MSTNMARTPLAARTRIDPSFSDGYDSDNLGALGCQNMSLAELRSPIEQIARTPQHIRFAESEPDQPAITVVSRTTNDCEMQLRQTVSMQLMEKQIRIAASKMRFTKSGKFLSKKKFQLAKVATRPKLGCVQVSKLLKRNNRGQRPLK